VIRSFRHKALRELFEAGSSRGVRPDFRERALARLDALDAARTLEDVDLPSWRLHRLQGKPTRYALAVNGPWRITFEWEAGDAWRVDLEQYH